MCNISIRSITGLRSLIFVGLSLVTSTAFADVQKPNIILIMADDMGYECINANGGTSYQTPHLDKLAETGMRFEHCYSQPLCTPSRVKIMTGMSNVRNYVQFGVLKRDQTTFAHLLKKAGYATCIVGKWQLGKEADSAQHFGFDESCLWQHTRPARDNSRDTRYPQPHLEINGAPKDYPAEAYGPAIVSDYLCDFMERHKDQPFLGYYPMILPHNPFVPTPDSEDPNCRDNNQNYQDMVAYIDKVVGKLVAKLDELGIRNNTLILFTCDNGSAGAIKSQLNGNMVQGAKGMMTDAGTHVPLIANWPGVIHTGKVSKDLVDFSDFLPTLCEAAKIEIPAELAIDGRSFLPLLQGEDYQPREWIYCWYSRGGGDAQQWARNQRYKLYPDGKLYDISQDRLEKTPLSALTHEEQQAHATLQGVLDQFKDARPTPLASAKKK